MSEFVDNMSSVLDTLNTELTEILNWLDEFEYPVFPNFREFGDVDVAYDLIGQVLALHRSVSDRLIRLKILAARVGRLMPKIERIAKSAEARKNPDIGKVRNELKAGVQSLNETKFVLVEIKKDLIEQSNMLKSLTYRLKVDPTV